MSCSSLSPRSPGVHKHLVTPGKTGVMSEAQQQQARGEEKHSNGTHTDATALHENGEQDVQVVVHTYHESSRSEEGKDKTTDNYNTNDEKHDSLDVSLPRSVRFEDEDAGSESSSQKSTQSRHREQRGTPLSSAQAREGRSGSPQRPEKRGNEPSSRRSRSASPSRHHTPHSPHHEAKTSQGNGKSPQDYSRQHQQQFDLNERESGLVPFVFRTGTALGVTNLLLDERDHKLLYTARAGMGVLSLNTGRSLGSLPQSGHSQDITSIDTSERLFATASADRTTRFFSWETMDCTRVTSRRNGHTEAVTGVKLQQQGSKAVTSGADGLLKQWETSEGKCLLTAGTRPQTGPIRALHDLDDFVFVTAGETIPGTAGQLCLWDTRTPTINHRIAAPTPLLCVDICGVTCGAGSLDGTVKLWDLRYLSEGKELTVHAKRATQTGVSEIGAVTHLQLSEHCTFACQPLGLSLFHTYLPPVSLSSSSSSSSAWDPSAPRAFDFSSLFASLPAFASNGASSSSLPPSSSTSTSLSDSLSSTLLLFHHYRTLQAKDLAVWLPHHNTVTHHHVFRGVSFSPSYEPSFESESFLANPNGQQPGLLAVGFADCILLWGSGIRHMAKHMATVREKKVYSKSNKRQESLAQNRNRREKDATRRLKAAANKARRANSNRANSENNPDDD